MHVFEGPDVPYVDLVRHSRVEENRLASARLNVQTVVRLFLCPVDESLAPPVKQAKAAVVAGGDQDLPLRQET